MSVSLWCVLVAFLLPYVCTWVAKFAGGGFRLSDNHDPREFQERLTGFHKRAHSAQLNGFETTPLFAAAAIIGHITDGASQTTLDVLGVLFITSRLLYIICYLADWATLRSLVWFVGLGICISFFVFAAG